MTVTIQYPTDAQLTTFMIFNHPWTAYQLPAQNMNF
jgi:hypothetical protein